MTHHIKARWSVSKSRVAGIQRSDRSDMYVFVQLSVGRFESRQLPPFHSNKPPRLDSRSSPPLPTLLSDSI